MRKLLLVLTAFLLLTGTLWAQKTITGKVTDDKGNPIPNASVQVRGANTGTTTKADGTYTLTVTANATRLIFSSIGMNDQQVDIGTRSTIDVQLATNVQDLSEVVVTVPYGTVKKTSFTGSETTISSKTIERQQVTNITKALDGLAPGVIASSGTGSPGSGATILLRGIGSFAANASPLYVLDGAPYFGDISVISTDDIESVTLLKDAAAAALFGSRGANGVIMITTKTGKKGRSSVTATVRQGFMNRGIPEYDKVLSHGRYYELAWEAIRNKYLSQGLTAAAAGVAASGELTSTGGLVYNSFNVPGNQLVDATTGKLNPTATQKWNDVWEDELFRTAPRTNATLNISGGNEKTDYAFSFGYLKEAGSVKNSDYERFNVRMNVNTAATTWLNAGVTIDGAFAKKDFITGENGGTAGSSAFFFSRTMGPIYPVYEYDPVTGAPVYDPETGEQKYDWGGTGSNMGTRPYLGVVNPLGQATLDLNNNQTLIGNASGYLTIKFTKELSLKTTLTTNIWDDRASYFGNNQYGDFVSVGGISSRSSDRQLTLTMNEVLTWTKDFGKHNVTALAGHENFRSRYNYLYADKQGYIVPGGSSELDNGTEISSQPSSYEDNHRLESYFAGVNYDFDRKYLISGSYRRDGSSRFSADNRWGNFYAVGLGWRLSEERFLQNVNWLNELKFKASYGELGNENLGAANYYPYKLYLPYTGIGGFGDVTRNANPDLKWEGNATLNVGFDFAMFRNRLQGTIEWYKRTSRDLLFYTPMPISTGFADRPQNIGTFENTGIDLQLGYNVIRKANFDWRIDLNLTHFRNKVTKLPETQIRTAGGVVNGNFKLVLGEDMYRFWMREFAGVDAATGEALYYQDILGTDGKPSGQRKITNSLAQASFYLHGTSLPDVSGGLTNSFRYKNFDFSFLFTFAYGGLYYDGNYASIMHSGTMGVAWHSDIEQRWQKPGDITDVPKIDVSRGGNSGLQDGVSTRFLFDRSYLNLKNITLSYTFPKMVSNRLGITNLQMFGNVDNAFMLSAKKGMNPQSNIAGTSAQSYPPFRTITVGISVGL